MSLTLTFPLGAGSSMTVTAHPTATPGLVVHDGGLFSDTWRLAHQSSTCALGGFTTRSAAEAAAVALRGVADWEGPGESLQTEAVIWAAIDAVEGAGGQFLCRPGGLGAQVAAKRTAHLATKGN